MPTVQEAFELALQHDRGGRLVEAETLYRRILAVQPNHAEALHRLGILAHRVGRNDLAVEWIRQATVLNPNNPAAFSNLGEAYRAEGQLDEAIASFHRALQLHPDLAESHNNLGLAWAEKGHLDEATAAYHRALELKAGYPEAHINLGNALSERGQFNEAMASFHRALQLRPDSAIAHSNAGAVLAEQGRLDEAIAACQRAIELQPGYADAWNNLGNAFRNLGQPEEAVAAYRRAVESHPAHAGMHSNLIHALHYHPAQDGRVVEEEYRRWNQRFSEPLKQFVRPPANDRDPGRRLRVGYISPLFWSNAVTFFLAPLLEAHDHRSFEVYCYAGGKWRDAVTDRLRQCADVWREVGALSAAQVAECVRADGIDIFVDLSMHTAGNRLPAFARRPAPVQISWLAYPGTTGVEAIDYRLTDANIDPVDQEDAGLREHPVRLPDCWCCYGAIEEFPAVGPLPAAEKGTITFGVVNQFWKTHEGLLRCWAGLLEKVPHSRLLIVGPEGQARERVQALFAAHAVARERVEWVAPCPWPDYIRLFERIDLALDSFPSNGMTTTCHTLWMGVPVVTHAGSTSISRTGRSLLHTIGLPEWVARSEEEYVRIAAEGAADLPRLAELRRTLRARMAASPLMDAPRFARNVEAAYRAMWRHWCAGPVLS